MAKKKKKPNNVLSFSEGKARALKAQRRAAAKKRLDDSADKLLNKFLGKADKDGRVTKEAQKIARDAEIAAKESRLATPPQKKRKFQSISTKPQGESARRKFVGKKNLKTFVGDQSKPQRMPSERRLRALGKSGRKSARAVKKLLKFVPKGGGLSILTAGAFLASGDAKAAVESIEPTGSSVANPVTPEERKHFKKQREFNIKRKKKKFGKRKK